MRNGTRLILVTTLILLGTVPLLIARAGPAQQAGGLSFGTLMNRGLVDWFNETAGPDDIATVKANDVSLLGEITAGKRQVIVASVAEAEELVPTIAGQFEIIGYDIEHWPQTPDEEQNDPVGATQRMRELADRYGVELALGPDRRFAVDYGAQMARYADRFTVQLQRTQDDAQGTLDFAQPLIEELLQANPDLKISVVIFPEEDNIEHLLALVEVLKEDIDLVSILNIPETAGAVRAFVEELRLVEVKAHTLPTATATRRTPAKLVATPTIAPSPTATPTALPSPTPMPTAAPLPTPTQPSTECTWPTGIVLTGSGLAALLARRRRRGKTRPDALATEREDEGAK